MPTHLPCPVTLCTDRTPEGLVHASVRRTRAAFSLAARAAHRSPSAPWRRWRRHLKKAVATESRSVGDKCSRILVLYHVWNTPNTPCGLHPQGEPPAASWEAGAAPFPGSMRTSLIPLNGRASPPPPCRSPASSPPAPRSLNRPRGASWSVLGDPQPPLESPSKGAHLTCPGSIAFLRGNQTSSEG